MLNLRSSQEPIDPLEALTISKKILFSSQIFQLSPQSSKLDNVSSVFQTPKQKNKRKDNDNDPESSEKSPLLGSIPVELRLSCPNVQKPTIFKKLGSLVQVTPKADKQEAKSTQRRDPPHIVSQGSQKSFKKGTQPSKEIPSIGEIDLYMSGNGFRKSRKYSKLLVNADPSKGENKQEFIDAVAKLEVAGEIFHNRIKTIGSVELEENLTKTQKSPVGSPVCTQKNIGLSFTPKIPKKVADKFQNLPSRGIRYVKAAQINGDNLNKYLQIKSPSQRKIVVDTGRSPKNETGDIKLTVSPTKNIPSGLGHKRVSSLGQGLVLATTKTSQGEIQQQSQSPEQDKYKLKNLKLDLPENNFEASSHDVHDDNNNNHHHQNQDQKAISEFEDVLLRQSQILKSRKGSRLFISVASPTSKREQKDHKKAEKLGRGTKGEEEEQQQHKALDSIFPSFIKEKGRKLSTLESTKYGMGSTTCNSSKMARGSLNIEKETEEKKPSNDSVLEDLLEMIGVKEEEEKEDWSFLEEKTGGFCGKGILFYGGCK